MIIVFKRALGALSGVLLATTMAAAPAAAQVEAVSAVVVTDVQPDFGRDALTIAGQNSGAVPFVTLDLIPLGVQSSSETEIVAMVPLAVMPPGEYLVTVSRGSADGEHASLHVTLGDPESVPGPAEAGDGTDAPAVEVPVLTPGEQAGRAAQVGDRLITIAEVDRAWQRQDPASYIAIRRQMHD